MVGQGAGERTANEGAAFGAIHADVMPMVGTTKPLEHFVPAETAQVEDDMDAVRRYGVCVFVRFEVVTVCGVTHAIAPQRLGQCFYLSSMPAEIDLPFSPSAESWSEKVTQSQQFFSGIRYQSTQIDAQTDERRHEARRLGIVFVEENEHGAIKRMHIAETTTAGAGSFIVKNGGRQIVVLPARLQQTITQVDVFAIHEKPLVKAANLF